MTVKFLIECRMDEGCDSGSPFDFIDHVIGEKVDKEGYTWSGVKVLRVKYKYPKGFSPDKWESMTFKGGKSWT